MHIRKGEPQDLPDALRLIQELAVFEKEPDAVITTVESMKKDGFGSGKIFDFFVAEVENTIVGLSLFLLSLQHLERKVPLSGRSYCTRKQERPGYRSSIVR
jgi:hypothetical protein